MSSTCTALVLIFSLALLFIHRSAFLNKQSVRCCDISPLSPPHLLGVGLALSVLDCLTSLLTLGLAETLSAPTGAPHQLAVLPRHRQHRGRHEREDEDERHLELHLWLRS